MTEPIIIKSENEIKTITHPTFGGVRYVVVEGRPLVFRPDLLEVCGFSRSSGSIASTLSNRHRKRRRQACEWILAELYGRGISPEPTLFTQTLTDAQIERIAECVADKLAARMRLTL